MNNSNDEVAKRNQLHRKHTLSHHHHMRIRWQDFFTSDNLTPAKDATLAEKSVIVGHIGMLLLSYGTGAWRVRSAMNTISRSLNMTCSADIGLVSLEYTCVDEDGHSYTQALSLSTTGVNTAKLNKMAIFVSDFKKDNGNWTIAQIHNRLKEINELKTNYCPWQVGLASGLACAGFIFLLGGEIIEVICSFFGAFCGNYVRRKMIDRHLTIIANIATSVAAACAIYVLTFYLIKLFVPISSRHLDGYIGAMLFVIPGFPFITSGLDMSKLDMRSGLERMAYAVMTVLVATAVGWAAALTFHLQPHEFLSLGLSPLVLVCLRLVASWCGVYGFSLMFNTESKVAAITGIIGAIANTTRLCLVDWTKLPPAAAAFIGALIAGLLASVIGNKINYPRIAITVPAIVIMVPGLYMYRAMYNFGLIHLNEGAFWTVNAVMIIFCLPMGLIAARILTDEQWRHNG